MSLAVVLSGAFTVAEGSIGEVGRDGQIIQLNRLFYNVSIHNLRLYKPLALVCTSHQYLTSCSRLRRPARDGHQSAGPGKYTLVCNDENQGSLILPEHLHLTCLSMIHNSRKLRTFHWQIFNKFYTIY